MNEKSTIEVLIVAQENTQKALEQLRPAFESFQQALLPLDNIAQAFERAIPAYNLAELFQRVIPAYNFAELFQPIFESCNFTELFERVMPAYNFDVLFQPIFASYNFTHLWQELLPSLSGIPQRVSMQISPREMPLSDRVQLSEGPTPAKPWQSSETVISLLHALLEAVAKLQDKQDASARRDVGQLVIGILALILAIIVLATSYGLLPPPSR